MRIKTIKNMLVAAVAIGISIAASAANYAPRGVHETIWAGQFAPDSPETVAMIRYGDEHPNFYNGQVNLSIPLYTWKDNLFEIPISLGYCYSGLKPGFTDSTVGLGWFLNAGGVITREVRGIPDETFDMTFPAAANLLSMYRDEVFDPEEDREEDPNIESSFPGSTIFSEPGSPYGGCSMRGFVNMYDGIFDSSALSSGNAMFLYTGLLANEFTMGVALDDDAPYHCVETEPDVFHFSFMGFSGSFILQPEGKVLILDSSTPAGELDIVFDCNPNEQGNGSYFVITTGDMVQYEFKAQVYSKSIEVTGGSDGGGDSDTFTSWKLSKIVHPSGHHVDFVYEDCVLNNYSAAKSRDHLTVDNGTGSGYHVVNNWQDPEAYSESSMSMVSVHDKRLVRVVVDGRGDMFFTYENDILSGLRVTSSECAASAPRLLREVSLSHHAPLSTGGGPTRCTRISFLDSVTVSGQGTYRFIYDSADDGRFPEYPDLHALYSTDWYGYYTTTDYATAYSSWTSSIYSLAQSVMTARSTYNLTRARMGAITRVTYPTGGYSTFEYESNSYRRVAGLSSIEDGAEHMAAGIRVRKVSSYDSDGTLAQERSITYALEDGTSSGVLLQPVTMDDIYFSYEFENRYSTLDLRVRREACSPLLDLGYTKEFHVEYLRVVEEVREVSSGPLVARTEHRFHSKSPQIENIGFVTDRLSQSSRYEEQMESVFEITRTTGPVLDWRMAGNLILGGREIRYEEQSLGSGHSSEATTTEYMFHTIPESVSGFAASYHGITILGGRMYARSYSQHLPYVARVTTTRVEADGSSLSTDVTISVNDLGQIARVTDPTSDGSILATSYTYHAAAPALVTSIIKTRNGAFVSKSEQSYQPLNADHSSCLLPYQVMEYAVSATGELSGSRVTATFGNYDSWCNPGAVTDASGRVHNWSWGYSGLHPISESISSGSRTVATRWEWIPMVGITAIVDPSGRETSFGYDEYGRLTSESDPEGHVVKEYLYNVASFRGDAGVPFTTSRNFIASLMHADAYSTARDVTFYDGLGHEQQTVSVTPGSVSCITQSKVDAFGRVIARSLPFGYSTQGSYASGWSAALLDQYSEYGENEVDLWSRTSFEARVSGRALSSTIPGSAFASHPFTKIYRVNESDEVRQYDYDPVGQSIYAMAYYPAETLCGVESTDGDGRRSIIWKDLEGRTVCAMQFGADGRVASTYYVYDTRSQLVWVLTPEGSALISDSETTPSSDAAKKHCYFYEYDDWGRMISKRLPGKDAEWFVYDSSDRVVLRSDGKLRQDHQWVFYWYNEFDELVQSSLVTKSRTRAQMQALFPASGAPLVGETAFGKKVVLTRNEYGSESGSTNNLDQDPSLDFRAEPGVVSAADLGTSTNLMERTAVAALPVARNITRRSGGIRIDHETGEPTLVMIRDTSYTYAMVSRVFYYDKCARVAQVVERNYRGGISRTSYRYDWAGNVLSTVERHTTSADDMTEDVKRCAFSYDARGRLLSEEVQVNGGEIASAEHSYNEIGQLLSSVLGDREYGIFQERAYTLQGWLGSSTCMDYGGGEIFSEQLRYEAPGFGTAQYSGNISEAVSQHRGQAENAQAFSYDDLGRFQCSRRDSWMPSGRRKFTEQGLTYDLNGNILTLSRYGANGSNAVDSFNYTYDGNKVSSIEDGEGNVYSYSYDLNGNQTHDGSRDLTIGYNYLNLPETVSESGVLRLSYRYAADGTKLQAMDGAGTGQAYLGSMVYSLSGDSCAFESTGFLEGRIVAGGWGTEARYYLTDHLGSVRCVAHGEEGDEGAVIYEQSDYYPFGMRMDNGLSCAMSPANRWRFSCKEDQPMMGENLQDFGSRYYDARIARWTTMDPMGEKYLEYSAFSYCACSPISNTDSTGAEWEDAKGNTIGDLSRVKVYIFFCDAFKQQALTQYAISSLLHGDGSVALSNTGTTSGFSEDWSKMDGNIRAVYIMAHGKNQSINIGNASPEQFTSTEDGRTNLSGRSATNLSTLNQPAGDISNAVLHLNTCHSMDSEVKAHGEGEHEQGAIVKGTYIGEAFSRNFNFKKVTGAAGSYNYVPRILIGLPQKRKVISK